AAKQAGCDEAVLYRAPDRVTEGSHSNIHILKDGTLHTAPLDNLILPGIARAHLLRACDALGIPYVEEPYTLDDLANAEEILMTSSSNLCRHADQLDGKPAGMKDPETYDKILTWLIDEFHTETSG
ncbi:MAG: aminotransferase class IV, partial [Clostridia bacterium]|nr:aminotransferase class IV [Clostridia bacterium]